MIASPQMQDQDYPKTGAVYLAPEGYEEVLAEELAHRGLCLSFCRGRLFGTKEAPRRLVWAQNTWLAPEFIPIRSIADAAKRLKAMQRNWILYPTACRGRAGLIKESLPAVSARPHAFGTPVPESPLGSFTLWDNDTLLASARCSSPFANGEIHFVENKTEPPNRAYLKLWEVFTRTGKAPGPQDLCIDLGGAPGGWTWAIAALGARVFSIDKAPLAPHVAQHPLVESCIGSAFALPASLIEGCTWLFCDVACYPDKLYKTVVKWAECPVPVNMVCTVKFSGKTNFSVIDDFSHLHGSTCIHLFSNKHEITWIRLVK